MGVHGIDLYIGYLSRHLEVLDAEICVHDDSNDGGRDSVEYFIGAGFAAVQKYMDEVIFADLSQKKNGSKSTRRKAVKNALKFGPMLSNGICFSEAIYGAANYWKHEGEWWEIAFSDDFLEQGKNNSLAHGKFGVLGRDWICSKVLFEVSGCHEMRLSSVLPLLAEWRIEFLENSGGEDNN